VWQREVRSGVALALPTAPPVAETARLARTAPPPRPGPLAWEVGASFAASFVGAFAAGGALELRLGSRQLGLGARVGVLGTGERTMTADRTLRVELAWTRIAGFLGPSYRFRFGPLRLEAHAELLLGGTLVRSIGDGLRDVGLALGTGGGVRLLWVRGPLAPFVQARVAGWPGTTTARVANGTPDGAEIPLPLPRVEGVLAIGISLGAF
jgi:hypothetical protein